MKFRLWSALVVMVLLSLSIGAVAAQHEGGTMASSLPVVGPDVTIRFSAQVGDRPAACGIVYEGLGSAGSTVSLNDYRFFVSNVRLINAAGEEVPVALNQDGRWQYDTVALLDFEDGTGLCSEACNADVNDKVTGTVPEGEYTGLVFDLGVPFELNHLDTTTAPAPLNIPAMWWSWQVGYKFVRIDMVTPGSQTPAWLVHLGSTGCQSADSNTSPTEACSNPNRTTVRFENFNAVQNFVVADTAGLLAGVNLDESIPMPPGCMSGPEDSDCATLFPGFGLDVATGAMLEGDVQTFFRAE